VIIGRGFVAYASYFLYYLKRRLSPELKLELKTKEKKWLTCGWMPHGDTSLIETGLLELAAFGALLGMC
jgi:hypothetical protein